MRYVEIMTLETSSKSEQSAIVSSSMVYLFLRPIVSKKGSFEFYL